MASYKNFQAAGYPEFRDGTIRLSGSSEPLHVKSRITLPAISGIKPKPIFRGENKKSVIAKAIDLMRDWRLTPFEHQGAVHSGIRAGLCLAGYDWNRADYAAAEIVAEALLGLGAKYPRWIEGQPEYVNSRDFCANIWCGGPLDDEDLADGRRFCCLECERVTRTHRREVWAWFHNQQKIAAERIAIAAAVKPRPCKTCGKTFKPKQPDTIFCSPTCRGQGSANYIPERACVVCGTVYKPNTPGSRYCSRTCLAREEKPEQNCKHCNKVFTPTGQKVTLFCSADCGYRWKYENRPMRQKQCGTCGTSFETKSPTAAYCSKDCRDKGRNTARGFEPTEKSDHPIQKLFDDAA